MNATLHIDGKEYRIGWTGNGLTIHADKYRHTIDHVNLAKHLQSKSFVKMIRDEVRKERT